MNNFGSLGLNSLIVKGFKSEKDLDIYKLKNSYRFEKVFVKIFKYKFKYYDRYEYDDINKRYFFIRLILVINDNVLIEFSLGDFKINYGIG